MQGVGALCPDSAESNDALTVSSSGFEQTNNEFKTHLVSKTTVGIQAHRRLGTLVDVWRDTHSFTADTDYA